VTWCALDPSPTDRENDQGLTTVARRKTRPDASPEAVAEAVADLDLRSEQFKEPLTNESKRFDIFLVDSGWNGPVSKAVREHLPLIYQFQRQDTLYILTPEQSVVILKQDPQLIGHDPTILVYDRFASTSTADPADRAYRGFRLNLGLMRRPEQALARLNEFVRFVAEHRTAQCLSREVRKTMHREGLQGMVKILREGLEAGAELV
jgi:hypothetical protein